jgi:hypothetical protein
MIKRALESILRISTPDCPYHSRISFAGEPSYHIRTFGERNADRAIYVIWRHYGVGLFSILSGVVSHLQIADSLDMTPVVDMQNFPSHYNEATPIHGVENSWDYYFQPVSNLSLDEVYESKTVIFCQGDFPANKPLTITDNGDLYRVFDKYIRFNSPILDAVSGYADVEFAGHRVLGVHFRGQEFRTAPGHRFPPTQQQMIHRATRLLDAHNFDRIFLVTEEQSYVDVFRDHFGAKLLCADSYRTYNENAYFMSPRDKHKYLLGLEVCKDMLLLSRCDGLLCSSSNVSDLARFLNRGQYDVVDEINNGLNTGNPWLCRYLWFVKQALPEGLGGFPPT